MGVPPGDMFGMWNFRDPEWGYNDDHPQGEHAVDESQSPHVRSIVGFSVQASDGGIGKIDEATYEAGKSRLVVDTGPWIFGKKVMLPAGVVEEIDWDTQIVLVKRTKEQIRNAPEWDEDSDEYRGRLTAYYADHEDEL